MINIIKEVNDIFFGILMKRWRITKKYIYKKDLYII